MVSTDTIRRYSWLPASVLAGLGLVALTNWPMPAGDQLTPSVSHLFGWLVRIEDTRWATGPFMGCVWVMAVFGYWKWRAPEVKPERGSWFWLAGFVILLAGLALGIKIQARVFSMSLVAPLLTCAAGWVLGGAILRRFGFSVFLLWVFVLPSPWIVRKFEAAQSLSQEWLQNEIGGEEAGRWEGLILYRCFPHMPNPVHTMFVTLVICWLIPGGLRWWVRGLLLVMGLCVSAADFLLNTGC